MEKWFGSRTDASVARVRQILTNARVFANGVTFRCLNSALPDGVPYAYVNPVVAFEILLGLPFFQTGTTGFDSKMGVVIHEMTHFHLVGGTTDSRRHYGVRGSLQLATTDPARAIRTADNYEYFVEALVFGL
nr:M35 family metallo-endopeptidase [Roseococcus sp. MDT2-1-1]